MNKLLLGAVLTTMTLSANAGWFSNDDILLTCNGSHETFFFGQSGLNYEDDVSGMTVKITDEKIYFGESGYERTKTTTTRYESREEAGYGTGYTTASVNRVSGKAYLNIWLDEHAGRLEWNLDCNKVNKTLF